MCYSSEHSLIMETHYKVRELENQKQLSGSPPVIATTVSLHLSQSFTLHSWRGWNRSEKLILFMQKSFCAHIFTNDKLTSVLAGSVPSALWKLDCAFKRVNIYLKSNRVWTDLCWTTTLFFLSQGLNSQTWCTRCHRLCSYHFTFSQDSFNIEPLHSYDSRFKI